MTQSFSNFNSQLLRIALLCVAIAFAMVTKAQQDTAIVRTYGGPFYEEGKEIIECATGGYAIIGTTGSDQLNNTNFYLLRLDEELNCIWNKNYGGAEVEWGQSIVEDSNGNLLICGYTNSFGEGGYDILVYKVNDQGDIIWQKTYGGSDWDFGYKIIAHPTEGYLICGKTYSYGNGGSDGYLIHISDDGNLLNEWTFGGEGDDELVDMVTLNGFINCVLNKSIPDSYELMGINLDGQIIASFQSNVEQSVTINSIVTNDNLIYLCGKWSGMNSFYNYYLCALNSEYEIQWELIGPEEYLFDITDIKSTNNELIYIGNTISFGYGGEEVLFHRRLLNSDWTAGPSFGSEANDYAFDLIIDSHNRPVSVGSTNGMSESNIADIYLIRLQDADLTHTYHEIDEGLSMCFTTEISNVDESNRMISVVQSGKYLEIKSSLLVRTEIRNALGQSILITTENQLDLSFLSNGLYIISASSLDNKIFTIYKFILN